MYGRQREILILTSIMVLAGISLLEWQSQAAPSATRAITGRGPSGPRSARPRTPRPLALPNKDRGPKTLPTPGAPLPSAPHAPPLPSAPHAPPLTPTSAPPAQIAAPDAPPRILSASLSPTVAQAGQSVSGTVIASSNVASVEARIMGYSATLSKVGVGEFHLTYVVPNLPPLLRRTYAVDVIARNARGDQATTQTTITIR